jgi:hypothetical protein
MIATRTAVVALMTFAAAVPATAQWRRVVFSGKGKSVDVPAPHALSYFTENPFLRDDGNEFCELCTPTGKVASSQKYTIRSMVKPIKPVGVLAGYRIVDVLYYASPLANASVTGAKWKSGSERESDDWAILGCFLDRVNSDEFDVSERPSAWPSGAGSGDSDSRDRG